MEGLPVKGVTTFIHHHVPSACGGGSIPVAGQPLGQRSSLPSHYQPMEVSLNSSLSNRIESNYQHSNTAETCVVQTFEHALADSHLSGPGSDIQNVTTPLVCLVDEKVAIYRHPLFPLLRILFEKSEMATHSIESVSSTKFDQDIKLFITQMARENKPFFTEDAEVDALMLKALQVLRIHLLELEKVNELCKDFCSRYISCLRGKLNSENVMRTLNINQSPPSSPMSMSSSHEILSPAEGLNGMQADQNFPAFDSSLEPHIDLSQADSNIDHRDPQSSGDANSMAVDHLHNAALKDADALDSSAVSVAVAGDTSGFLSKKGRSKRGVLPKHATHVLKGWLFQHIVHPYPTEDEKRHLAEQTNLTNIQVNNWFINARRRILQPMLDNTSPGMKSKKPKPQKCPAQKDWTSNVSLYSHETGLLPHPGVSAPMNYVDVAPRLVSQASEAGGLGTLSGSEPSHSMVISQQPVQLIQVSQLPMVTHDSVGLQAVSHAYIQVPAGNGVPGPSLSHHVHQAAGLAHAHVLTTHHDAMRVQRHQK